MIRKQMTSLGAFVMASNIEQHDAICVRVSTKRQDEASQVPDLARWQNGQANPEKVRRYMDRYTGKSMDRPGWNKLWAAVERGEVKRIVIWRLDRLGRTAAGLTRLFEELRARKINLVSLKDGLDLATPAGRLMANVLASVAQFETEVRAERVLAGQEAARVAGKTWGGSKKGRLLKVTSEQIAAVARMKAAEESVTAMARATGLSRPTIYNIIENHLTLTPA